MQRDDDTPEAVNRRLDLYETQTSPLIEYYQSQSAHWSSSTASAIPTTCSGASPTSVDNAKE